MSLAEEVATVSFIKGEYAYLKAESASACSSCSAKSGCGAKTATKSDSNYTLRVKNTLNLKQGDSVVLSLEANKLLLGTVIMYILPLIMLFIFAYLGKVGYGEAGSIAGGIIGLLGGLLLIRKILFKDGMAKNFEPTVIYKSSALTDK